MIVQMMKGRGSRARPTGFEQSRSLTAWLSRLMRRLSGATP